MTRAAFERLMDIERWLPSQRLAWRSWTPSCEAETLHREMARPDGMIPVSAHKAA